MTVRVEEPLSGTLGDASVLKVCAHISGMHQAIAARGEPLSMIRRENRFIGAPPFCGPSITRRQIARRKATVFDQVGCSAGSSFLLLLNRDGPDVGAGLDGSVIGV